MDHGLPYQLGVRSQAIVGEWCGGSGKIWRQLQNLGSICINFLGVLGISIALDSIVRVMMSARYLSNVCHVFSLKMAPVHTCMMTVVCIAERNFLGNPKTISGAVRGKVPSGVSYDRALPRELADGLLGLGGTSHWFLCVWIVEVVCICLLGWCCYEREVGNKDDTCMEISMLFG